MLLEILIAGVCLAGASVGVLAALRFANDRDTIANQRMLALQLVRSEVEKKIGIAIDGSLVAGTSTQTLTNAGIPYSVTLTTTATQVGTTDRYTVTSTATWTLNTSFGTSTQTVKLQTLARNGDVN